MQPVISYPSFWLSPNEHKGYLFEQWVVNQFPEKDFQLKEWRSDKHIGKRAAASGRFPDLIFQYRAKKVNTYFAIECKFRTKFLESRPKWAEQYQVENYLDFQDKAKIQVFIALGIGGHPHDPESTSLIPLAAFDSVYASKKIRSDFKTLDFPGSLALLLKNKRQPVSRLKTPSGVSVPIALTLDK